MDRTLPPPQLASPPTPNVKTRTSRKSNKSFRSQRSKALNKSINKSGLREGSLHDQGLSPAPRQSVRSRESKQTVRRAFSPSETRAMDLSTLQQQPIMHDLNKTVIPRAPRYSDKD